MCMSARPSVMSRTLIYSGEAIHNEKYVHVLAYQNSANSQGPNAMILPFPTSQEMGPENIVDTTQFSRFLKDITNASRIDTLSDMLGGRLNSTRSFTKAAVIIESGSYTVVLAHDPKDIPDTLAKLPENKRVEISDAFLEGYAALYPDQPIAVCCWNGNIKAEPLLWWYEPADKDNLFIPTMDAHDGNAPVPNSLVGVDHNISVGSTIQDYKGAQVTYSNLLSSQVKSLLPTSVFGTKIATPMLNNGDMWAKTASMDHKITMNRGMFATKQISALGFRMLGWE
jgi:hypothetical protein